MVNICQYSILIYTGNVVVLLVVAVFTDYWQYRGFDMVAINETISLSGNKIVTKPRDTNSYITISYETQRPVWALDTSIRGKLEYYISEWREENDAAEVGAIERTIYEPPITTYTQVQIELDGISLDNYVNRSVLVKDTVFIYWQYGNLFRECDDLEVGVRRRLGLIELRTHRCYGLFTEGHSRAVRDDVPAIVPLEHCAFAAAMFSIAFMLCGVGAGAYGSLCESEQRLIMASSMSLLSGLLMTGSIAIFHAKCHLLRRREIVSGRDVPYKDVLEDDRMYGYGWSFFLAWICVGLCFIASYVWLHKSQYLGIPISVTDTYFRRNRRASRRRKLFMYEQVLELE